MLGKLIIKLANWYDKYTRYVEMENEQYFIEWQDALNEISVR